MPTWPLETLAGRRPKISDGFQGRRADHNGVDIMFPRIGTDPPFVKGVSVRGSKLHYVPEGARNIAYRAGVVKRALFDRHGGIVELDHGDGWHSIYRHNEKLLVRAGETVFEGYPVGVCGGDPTQSVPLVHLHFELTLKGVLLDPEPYLRRASFADGGGNLAAPIC